MLLLLLEDLAVRWADAREALHAGECTSADFALNSMAERFRKVRPMGARPGQRTRETKRGKGFEADDGLVRMAKCGHLCLRWGAEHKCCRCRGNNRPCRLCAIGVVDLARLFSLNHNA